MSEDSFLARWSKRKAAAKAEPQPERPREETNPPASEAQAAAEPAPDEVDLSALPSLDEITSATDITGFLKRGVPEALRTAALRKAWSSDPMIRDFIGLSENAWDFNDPTAIPGFGPIDMPAEQVRQMAAELVGEVKKAAATIDNAVGEVTSEQPDTGKLQAAPADPENLPRIDTAMQQNEPPAVQQDDSPAAEERPAPRSHGSALPR
jgi:hypothetical protein